MKMAIGFVLMYLVTKYTNPVLDHFAIYTDTGKLIGHLISFLIVGAIYVYALHLSEKQ